MSGLKVCEPTMSPRRGHPELHGDFVRHKFPAAGVFQEGLAHRRAGVELAKHVAASAVKKKRGIAPRILPCVPLPLPGAPKMR